MRKLPFCRYLLTISVECRLQHAFWVVLTPTIFLADISIALTLPPHSYLFSASFSLIFSMARPSFSLVLWAMIFQSTSPPFSERVSQFI